jgi:integrase
MATGIYKRGRIYWVNYTGLDGKTKWESSRSTKFADAQALRTSRLAAINAGKEPEVKKRIVKYDFNQLAEKYEEFCKNQKGFSKKKNIVKHLVARFNHLPLRMFTLAMLEQLQVDKQETLAPATVNRHFQVIKHMFKKAADWDMVEEEIAKKVFKVKMLKENNRRLRFLSVEEWDELVNVSTGRIHQIIVIALNTGMRRGEIFKLKWEDIDRNHGFISVKDPKNSERREIPINQTVNNVLDTIVRRLDVPYVFFEETIDKKDKNKRICKPITDVKRSFGTALKKAGVRDFHFHDLRHTFASHLVMGGIDITTVSRLLGHKSLTMTLRYSHLAPKHLSSAVSVLNGIHRKGKTALEID